MDTMTPGTPVNCSATAKGCDRKRCTRRARFTVRLVFVRKLVHAEDGNDVLQLLVPLQDLFDALGRFVMFLSHDERIKNTRCGFQRIHRRINAQLRDLTAQYGRGIQDA